MAISFDLGQKRFRESFFHTKNCECVSMSFQEVRVGEHFHKPVCDQPAVALLPGLVCWGPLSHHQRHAHPQEPAASTLSHGERQIGTEPEQAGSSVI